MSIRDGGAQRREHEENVFRRMNEEAISVNQDNEFRYIAYGLQDGVARITLNQPERMNVLGIGPGSSRDEIARAMALADADEQVGVVLIDAAGGAFCAGGDLTGAAPAETPLDEHLFSERILQFYAAFRAMHKPVIAAVHGLCLGAGMGMIAQCDIVLAADDARFGLVEGRIGHPGASELVPLIGATWAKYLILTGDYIDAWRAADIGLVLTVLPESMLHERAFDLARRIARMPRESVLLNKACIDGMSDAMGRHAARLVGRAHDTITKSMSSHACAPDGRRFVDILREGGMPALKRARDAQFTGSWLEPLRRAWPDAGQEAQQIYEPKEKK